MGIINDAEELKPIQQRGKEKDPAENILPFRDPGDGLNIHRMNRKNRGGNPGAQFAPGKLQLFEQVKNDHAGDHVEQDIVDVIAGGVEEIVRPQFTESPKAVFHPKRGEDQRIILRIRIHIEPDLRKPLRGLDGCVVRQPRFIVPNENALQRRQIKKDGEHHDGESRTPAAKRALWRHVGTHSDSGRVTSSGLKVERDPVLRTNGESLRDRATGPSSGRRDLLRGCSAAATWRG